MKFLMKLLKWSSILPFSLLKPNKEGKFITNKNPANIAMARIGKYNNFLTKFIPSLLISNYL